MSTYFAFSDECGAYYQRPTKKQLDVHPYYIRATLLMNASEWKNLNLKLNALKDKYSIPQHCEVKWAYLWKLAYLQKGRKPIPTDDPCYFLRNYNYQDIIEFVDNSLNLLNSLNYKKIIVTFTDNSTFRSFSEKYILSFHIQELMQRIEMELSGNSDNLAVLFFDPVSETKNNFFREIYFDFYKNGDFINKYAHIKDCLNIEYSHQSCGIQIADYIAGAFSSVLKSSGNSNYQQGVEMYFKSIHPNLRRGWRGLWGFGIREVPRDLLLRIRYRDKVQTMKEAFDAVLPF